MKPIFSLLLLSLLVKLSFAQNYKQEATDFFKKIVGTFFNNDCDGFYNSFGDSVIIISQNGVGVLPTDGIKQDRKACDKFPEFTRMLQSFQQYLNEYTIIALSKGEFTAANSDTVSKLISAEHTGNLFVYEIVQEESQVFRENDMLIFGNIHRSDSRKNISYGPFWMVLRKTAAGWIIAGITA